MDLDLRKLRYFVTVAECASFRGASQELRIAQPALSRQIRSLENELRVTLFVRTPRGVVLTGEGRRVLDEARPLLQSSTALVHRARDGAGVSRTFTVAFRPGIGVASVIRQFRARHHGLSTDIVMTSLLNQVEVVRDARADVSFARTPSSADNLTQLHLYDEARLVAIAADHPLATHGHINARELAYLGVLQSVVEVPELAGRQVTSPAARNARMSTTSHDLHTIERLERVAAGEGTLVAPRSVASLYHRPDVTWIELERAAPSTISLLHPADSHDPLILEFAQIASDTLGEPAMSDDALAASG